MHTTSKSSKKTYKAPHVDVVSVVGGNLMWPTSLPPYPG